MNTIVTIAGVAILAAAGWYAYKKGYLDDITGLLEGLGSGGGTEEPAPEPEEEPKKDEKKEADPKAAAPKEEEEEKPKKKKSKLALAYMGSFYDGEVLDKAYYVTEPSSFIPRTRSNYGIAIA